MNSEEGIVNNGQTKNGEHRSRMNHERLAYSDIINYSLFIIHY
jgi:hypothetical protein